MRTSAALWRFKHSYTTSSHRIVTIIQLFIQLRYYCIIKAIYNIYWIIPSRSCAKTAGTFRFSSGSVLSAESCARLLPAKRFFKDLSSIMIVLRWCVEWAASRLLFFVSKAFVHLISFTGLYSCKINNIRCQIYSQFC